MMQRFAGDNEIMQKMAANLNNQRQRNRARLEDLKIKQAQQIQRDVAAVYGDIIPFT